MGTYPGPRNWEVNPDVDPSTQCLDNFGLWKGFNPGDGGAPYTGCAYGGEFYRTLMTVQLGPYIKNKQIWYCPSDKARSASPANMAKGLQSYQWFPNWIYNAPGTGFPLVKYPDGTNHILDNPSAKSDKPADRMLFIERGAFGWDGGLGSSFLVDPIRDLIVIVLTQRVWDTAQPPAVHTDIQAAAYDALR